VVFGTAMALCACAAVPAQPDPRAAIGGRVIDAATGSPIEGAVVIATWRAEVPPTPGAIAMGIAVGGHGGAERRTAYIGEAVTDREGRFTIPAWSAAEQWYPGNLTSASPSIRFLAPGYAPASATLGSWIDGHGSELEPGIRGPRVMALFRPGRTPKQDLGRDVSGLAARTADEEQLEALRKFQAGLEADAAEADVARERARTAQREARSLVSAELRKANKEHKP
jgi:hypothetical protein